MCDVTSQNFDLILPDILDQIRKCSFVAFDAEFTGLTPNGNTQPSLFDSGAERYLKLRANATSSIIQQIGLSLFVHGSENTYTAYSYNFYICPKSFGDFDPRFICQASCLEFLTLHKFDFNKFVYDGIPYLTESDEKQVLEMMSDGFQVDSLDGEVSFSDEDLIKDVNSRISEWNRTGLELGSFLEVHCVGLQLTGRFVLHSQIREKHKNLWTETRNQSLVAMVVSSEDRNRLEAEKGQDLSKEIISELLGFSKVLREILSTGKPMVGHNCILDMMKMFHQFHNPLPATYDEFKLQLTETFPRIYDTKHITFKIKPILEQSGLDHLTEAFQSTNLEYLYHQVTMPGSKFSIEHTPWVKHAPGFNKYEGVHKLHEAGYDAFITGLIFVKTAHVAAATSYLSVDSMKPLNFNEHEYCVKQFVNQFHIARALIPFMNTSGPDPPSNRPDQLHVQLKSGSKIKKLIPHQVRELFSRFGSIDVKQLNQRSVLVAVNNRKSSRDILQSFRNHPDLRVANYNAFLHGEGICSPFGLCKLSAFLLLSFGAFRLLAGSRK